MKKINFIKYLALISVLVFACDVKANTFPHGIYLGAGGGYNHTKTEVKNIVGRDLTDIFFSLPGGDNDLRSGLFHAFLGYLHVFHKCCVTLGGEVFYSYIGAEKTFTTQAIDPNGPNDLFTIRSKLRNEYEYGFKAILGYLIAQTNHIYLVLGYSRNEFCRTDTLVIGETGDSNQVIDNQNINVNNFIFGLGMEKGTDTIRFGIEWFYRFNKKPTKSLSLAVANGGGSTSISSATTKINGSHVILVKASFNLDIFTKH